MKSLCCIAMILFLSGCKIQDFFPAEKQPTTQTNQNIQVEILGVSQDIGFSPSLEQEARASIVLVGYFYNRTDTTVKTPAPIVLVNRTPIVIEYFVFPGVLQPQTKHYFMIGTIAVPKLEIIAYQLLLN